MKKRGQNRKKLFAFWGIFFGLVFGTEALAQISNNPRQAGQVIVSELVTRPNKLIVRVGSSGCTDKSSFSVEVKKQEGLSSKSPHYLLTLIRTKPDECKAIVEGGTLITFDLEKDLNLTGYYTYSVLNGIFQNPELTINEARVKNYRYYLAFGKKYVQLKDGGSKKGNNPDNYLNAELKIFSLGDLDGNGTDDAVVILVHNSMGSGSFFELTGLVADPEDDCIRQTNSILLGDRIIIHSLSLNSGKILLDHTVAQPGDPSCCPTKRIVRQFRVTDNRITEIKE